MEFTLDFGESISPAYHTTCHGLSSVLSFSFLVVCCLRKTIFSPYLAISISIALHFRPISSPLVLIISYLWGAATCLISGSVNLF